MRRLRYSRGAVPKATAGDLAVRVSDRTGQEPRRRSESEDMSAHVEGLAGSGAIR
jgi:hypothetical protein